MEARYERTLYMMALLGRAAACALAGLLVLVVVPTTALAQAQPSPNVTEVGTEKLQPLLELLEDDARRVAFVANLEALIAAQSQTEETPPRGSGQNLTQQLSQAVDEVSKRTIGGVNAVLNIRELFRQVGALFADPAVRSRWSEIALKMLLVLVPAAIAFVGVRQTMRSTRDRMVSRRAKEVLSRLSTLLLRMVIDVLPILAFGTAAYAILPLTEPRPFTRIIAISAINVTLMIQAALLVARAVLVPNSPHLRLFRMRDVTAAYIYVWVRRLAYLGGYVFVVAGALSLLGFSQVGTVVSRAGGLTITVMLVILILQNRTAARRFLRCDVAATHPTLSVLRRQFAEVWHILALLYVAGTFLVWSLRLQGGFSFLVRGTTVSVLAFVGARILIGAMNHAVTTGFSVGSRLRRRYPTLEHRANLYLPVLRTVAVAAIYVIAALVILEAWQVRVGAWLASDIGQRFASGVVTIAMVLLVALLLWEFVSSAVERYLNATDEDGDAAQRSARERTLLPLLRNALLVVIIVVVSLIILSEIGINIAPLLAAAGVVGIAVGFGSQKLVQDVINGLFILFEDTISVGDVVEVAGHAGLVESISVRTLTLRDLEGQVRTVPFSEVATIRNMTKDFSFALMDVGIAYRENVAEVIEVLKQIGAELEADPSLGPLILEPIEILGLDQFGDSAIVVKARIKTKPIKQWAVKRAFNLRMKERFDALGIEIPYPHMTLYFGADKIGEAPPAFVSLAQTDAEKKKQSPKAGTIEETAMDVKDAPAPADE